MTFRERTLAVFAQTRKIIELFSPNLILGVSDEPSPVCDIERVRLVAEMVNDLGFGIWDLGSIVGGL